MEFISMLFHLCYYTHTSYRQTKFKTIKKRGQYKKWSVLHKTLNYYILRTKHTLTNESELSFLYLQKNKSFPFQKQKNPCRILDVGSAALTSAPLRVCCLYHLFKVTIHSGCFLTPGRHLRNSVSQANNSQEVKSSQGT